MSFQQSRPDVALADFVTAAGSADVPDEGVRAAERAFVDTVGVSLPGAAEPASRAARTLFAGESGPARVLGTDERASPADAAFVNATAGHALDYDDVTAGVWHPSVTLVAPLLAVGEQEDATGQDLLTGFAVGFEVQHYLGEMILPAHYERGWHATSTLGTVGATAAVASVLDLDGAETRHALNCAASMASGLKKNFGTMTKPLHAGHAARNGTVAAMLAAEGFTATAGALGDDGGFCDLYSGDSPPEMDVQRTPGDPWAIVESGIDVKKYPCCYYTHAPIAAAQHLVTAHDLTADDVEAVTVHASEGALATLQYEDPTTGLEGKFSMEYAVAAAIARDRVGLGAFEDDAVGDPTVQAVRERVSVVRDPDLAVQPYTATVELETTAGETYRHTQDQPPGTAEDPLSDEELRAKFEGALDHAPGALDVAGAYDRLDDLRNQGDLTAVTAALTPTN